MLNFFCNPYSDLLNYLTAPCTKYISGWVIELARKIDSSTSTLVIIFTAVKICESWHLRRSSFQTKENIECLK